MKSYAFSFLALLAIAGCSSSPSTTPQSSTTSAIGSTTEGTPKTGTDGATQAPTAADLPASLKTDAYSYFGLGYTQTMNVELRVKGQPTKTGGVTVKLMKVEGDTATYQMERTGGIAEDLGTDTILVDKTGVYVVGSTTGTITPPKNLQLPSVLTPNTKWPSKTKVSRSDGQELEENSTYVVQGTKSITTQVGKYDALVVTSTGTALVKTLNGQKKAKYETTSYYVKDRGMVKAVISMTLEGQQPNEVVIEETK